MYKIIGANQSEYGPATVEQIRQWIAEGRINAQTSCQAAGETDWKPVASVPAFADLFAAAPPAPPLVSPPLMPPPLGNNFPNVNGRAKALEEVGGPAIGLIVTAVLGILNAILQRVVNLFTTAFDPFRAFGGMNLPPQSEQFSRTMHLFGGAMGAAGGILALAMGVFIIFAALKMKRLENHGLCLGASIVALVPCISPCCLLGIPFGIWALMVLNKPEIKSQFT